MLSLGKPITINTMIPKSFWELKVDVNGYKTKEGSELATQAVKGRSFELLEIPEKPSSSRIKVRLLEDGYICWLQFKDIENLAFSIDSWEAYSLSKTEINRRLPKVLNWVEKASRNTNQYLWGGTIGPDFDCSGLIQSAFASQQIWLPRDSYQQENFCRSITFELNSLDKIICGDLIFFGTKTRCTHVGIYKGKGLYWHSSGRVKGRNGIGIDELKPNGKNIISAYYLSKLRSIGRVESSYDGSIQP